MEKASATSIFPWEKNEQERCLSPEISEDIKREMTEQGASLEDMIKEKGLEGVLDSEQMSFLKDKFRKFDAKGLSIAKDGYLFYDNKYIKTPVWKTYKIYEDKLLKDGKRTRKLVDVKVRYGIPELKSDLPSLIINAFLVRAFIAGVKEGTIAYREGTKGGSPESLGFLGGGNRAIDDIWKNKGHVPFSFGKWSTINGNLV